MADRPSSAASSRRGQRASAETVGQFVIDQEIGKGSFAQVYSGRHKLTGGLVAIKSVDVGRLNKKLKENLYSEIKILKTLRHPHIVALHECVESATHINLIMEYCELGDLSLFIRKREKLITNPATHDIARKYPNAPNSGLNEVVVRHFLKQLASALKFLRNSNLVHRDVKPQNLLLLPSPKYRESHKDRNQILSASHDSLIPVAGLASLPMLKLADFGFARHLPSTSLAETLCGSPLYMAPEILKYEKYDAKADLWSVGTVLYEMATGRPPFRAGNHVELLRKIEAAEDVIKFPRETIVTPEMKSLIRALLKRAAAERITFENFFSHTVVTGPIPGLVEDDVPREERRVPDERRFSREVAREVRATARTDEAAPLPRRQSFRRYPTDQDAAARDGSTPSSPKPMRSSPLATPEPRPNPLEQPNSRMSYSPRYDGEAAGTRRPQPPQSSTSAPSRPALHGIRTHRLSNASLNRPIPEGGSPTSPLADEDARAQTRGYPARQSAREQEKAAQDMAFEREYVVIDRNQVEVNAIADAMDADRRVVEQRQSLSPKSGQMVRRATQQGGPTSTTGAIPAQPSRAVQIAQGKMDHYRQSSVDKIVPGSSPLSKNNFIAKAIQDASVRVFGLSYPANFFGKGPSPPRPYSPFPTFPIPAAPVGLLGDGRQAAPVDEESRVAQTIEDYATRSDVVYGFAEVKYKQFMPLAPSAEQALGGLPAEKTSTEEDVGLTIEAIVSLSEEALVLYVKALALLAKSINIASLWWAQKHRSEPSSSGNLSARDPSNSQALALKINSVVQWVRGRFNGVLEKAEIVRLKLVEAQKLLPEDHPSHPSNHPTEPSSASSSAVEGVFLTAGISAEKLMYDRALEMSRAAAINEITNEDLQGCELSYVTAIRMLEAVLDNDDDLPKRKSSGAAKEDRVFTQDEPLSEMNAEDQQAVQKVIHMITTRLATVRKKMQMIQQAAVQQQQQSFVRRRSGDVTPRSVQSHAS